MRENVRNIPFSPPNIGEKEIKNVIEVLESGWITTGPKTKEFERKISEYCNTDKTLCVNSATAGMELVLRLLGVGEGDEVITTAYTYTATASVIYHTGAKIVLVDTDEDSYEMDYTKMEQAITEKTKVIIPVDLAGIMCDYDKIFEIVNRNKNKFIANNELQQSIGRIVVLADGAHSFGAKYKGKMSGEVADFTSFSFHAVKNLTTAEGGAITWNKELNSTDIYRKLNILSLHGQTKDALAKTEKGAWEYDIIEPAYKCNMTDIMAAIGMGQLERYEETLKYRRRIIEKYDSEFLKEPNFQILRHYIKNNESSGHLYMLRIKNKTEIQRNEIIKNIAKKGISVNVHYKPLPMLTAYKNLGYDIKDFPNSYLMYKNEITLPVNNIITMEEIDYIINTIKQVK